MKAKIVGVLLILLLLLSSYTFANVPKGDKQHITFSQHFSPPVITENDDTVSITVQGVDQTLFLPDEFMVPVHIEVLTFPLGTKITDIQCRPHTIRTLSLPKKLETAPHPVPRGLTQDSVSTHITRGWASTPLRASPSDWYTYHMGVGRDGTKHVLYLSLHIYPCRYSPSSNEIKYTDAVDIQVEYTFKESSVSLDDVYDLLIISPSEFAGDLSVLVSHKESHGIKTKLVTTDAIYENEYFTVEGRDDAEKVKYFIKYALEEWGIDYTLLVGGLTSKLMGDSWHVPVRYSLLSDRGGYSEPSYLTDLYFADIYKIDGDGNLAFEDWDSNQNDVFAEWPSFGVKDELDMYPDVYVGRLACRDTREVQTLVEKIITYENGHDGQDMSWFNRLVVAGGDTFNDVDAHNYFEGELANQKVSEILSGFETERIWWTSGNFNQRNVVDAFSAGCGFAHLSGHGSPGMWMAKDFTEDDHGKYLLGLDVYHMPRMSNDGQYPIVVIGGCHNSMFNATLFGSLIGCIQSLTGQTTWYWMPIPECFGWWLVKQPNGGAIATFGCTGLGLGTIGDRNDDGIPDSLQYLLTWLELRFFELYADQGISILGETYGTAITDYINTFDCHRDKGDRKTIEEWVFLGDPSLLIGGYFS